MTHHLIDTNVISATVPTVAVKLAALIDWMDTHSSSLFLSAVTIAVIAEGTAKAKREGAKRKASNLSAWLRTALHLYSDRVPPFDGPTRRLPVFAGLVRSRSHSPGVTELTWMRRSVASYGWPEYLVTLSLGLFCRIAHERPPICITIVARRQDEPLSQNNPHWCSKNAISSI